jgi:hypothetical protein
MIRRDTSLQKEKSMKISQTISAFTLLGAAAVLACAAVLVHASSHREAPFITEIPKVDGTDVYMFNSYETGREGFVTLVANYQPLQAPYGGPNYFFLDPNALYEFHIDNNGDSREDFTFQFQFQNTIRGLSMDIDGQQVAIPLFNVEEIGPGRADTTDLNVIETYTVNIVRGDRRSGEVQAITDADTGAATFSKPVDNIGTMSIPDYAAYAAEYIHTIAIPGCENGRMFVGQRDDPFVVNLGEVFDRINTNPLGPPDAERDLIEAFNVTSFILEVPATCLTAGGDPVIGGWSTASLRQARILNPAPSSDPAEQGPALEGGAWTQVSRLGNPLVNELVIGLPDKDRFNASEPKDDAQFAFYVTNPTYPAIIERLFPVTAPALFPREDLVAVFLTGVNTAATGNVTQPNIVQAAEMMRLNTSIPASPATAQNNLGVIWGDNAGYPNGRRPGDDVVDIVLRVAMGRLITLGLFGDDPAVQAPSGGLDFTDGALVNASMFDDTFPYLKTPLPGSPTPGTPN